MKVRWDGHANRPLGHDLAFRRTRRDRQPRARVRGARVAVRRPPCARFRARVVSDAAVPEPPCSGRRAMPPRSGRRARAAKRGGRTSVLCRPLIWFDVSYLLVDLLLLKQDHLRQRNKVQKFATRRPGRRAGRGDAPGGCRGRVVRGRERHGRERHPGREGRRGRGPGSPHKKRGRTRRSSPWQCHVPEVSELT